MTARREGPSDLRMRGGWAVVGAALLLAIATGGCSSSSAASGTGTPCADNPLQCPTGTTCWAADTVPNLECLPSSPGAGFGAACQQKIGQPTCADGLACDQSSAAAGSCTYYCGAAGHGCPAGYDCRQTHVATANGPAVDICRPSGLMVDGGPPPGDGGADDGPICIGPIPEGGVDGMPGMM